MSVADNANTIFETALTNTAVVSKYLLNTFGGALTTIKTAVIPSPLPPPKPVIMEPLPLWKLAGSAEYYVRIAGLMGASAVALGAYGAHSAFQKDDKIELKEVFDRANKYHFIHSLALLGVPLCRWPKTSGTFFILGIVMFSGTCYYLALTGDRSFSKLTPVGGICFIIGWLAMML